MITDIQFGDDGQLSGRLFGLWEIYGEDLEDLKVAALEAFDAFCIVVEKQGTTLQAELRDAIEYAYSKDKSKWQITED